MSMMTEFQERNDNVGLKLGTMSCFLVMIRN